MVQSGTKHLDWISSIGRMMFQRNDVLNQVQIYNIRRPLDAHSQLFGSSSAVERQFDCLERNQRGPWLVESQLHGQYEWLEHIDNTYYLNPVVARHIQLNTQFQPDPNLFKSIEKLKNKSGSIWQDKKSNEFIENTNQSIAQIDRPMQHQHNHTAIKRA